MIRRTETLVEAVNGALRLLGERPLASLDEDRVSALRAKEALGDVLAAIIREFDWNFAQGEAVLPADPAYTAGRFAFGYRLPADCLRVVSVVDVDDAAWQIVDG
ncbi:MAG TPA: hypothetical protein PLJ34_11380, partial [Hyphomicrobiales bacterium]|nr:hypothetical protein [Hyphomicrobiales bacterium]